MKRKIMFVLLACMLVLGNSLFVFADTGYSEEEKEKIQAELPDGVDVTDLDLPSEKDDYILVVFDNGEQIKLYPSDEEKPPVINDDENNMITPFINIKNKSIYLTAGSENMKTLASDNNWLDAYVKVTFESGPGSVMVWPDSHNPVQMAQSGVTSATFFYPWNYGKYNIDVYAPFVSGTYYFSVKD